MVLDFKRNGNDVKVSKKKSRIKQWLKIYWK